MVASVLLLFPLLTFAAASKPRVVSLPVEKRQALKPSRSLSKRGPFTAALSNLETFYSVNVSIGTSPQPVSLQIDTGSSDIWAFGPGSCDGAECFGGVYDPAHSTSSTLIAPGAFEISYVQPGSGVVGDYISDDFQIGGMTINNLTMAVATRTEGVDVGVMGIDFDIGESIVADGEAQPYPNIIDTMVSQGLIMQRAYSLYLDDIQAGTGTILFGGYDTTKFQGLLSILDIQPDQQAGTYSSMTVIWSGLGLNDTSGEKTLSPEDFPELVVLDSGTSNTILPDDLYQQLASYFQVTNDPQFGAVVPCNLGQTPETEGNLNFQFGTTGGPTIAVPFEELAVPLYDYYRGRPVTGSDGQQICGFGLMSINDVGGEGRSPFLFGDTFLRSAYVVYDLDALEIGIAQAVYNVTESNVVEIPAGQLGDINGAQTVASQSTIIQTASGALPAPGTQGASSVPTSGATASTSATGSSLGTIPGTPTSFSSIATSVTTSAATSVAPSVTPGVLPSVNSSVAPSVTPSVTPTAAPTVAPSVAPSVTPSIIPSIAPSIAPSVATSVTTTVETSAATSMIATSVAGPSTNTTTAQTTYSPYMNAGAGSFAVFVDTASTCGLLSVIVAVMIGMFAL